MKDPMVIDPPGFDQQAAWKECGDYVEQCGGLTHDDGEPNWRAAFGADPGICSCPNCDQYFWAWGNRQRCTDCGFEYETDWWSMFSWGAQAGRAVSPWKEKQATWSHHIRRLKESKVYRWAFENKPEPGMEAAKALDRPAMFPEDATHLTPR